MRIRRTLSHTLVGKSPPRWGSYRSAGGKRAPTTMFTLKGERRPLFRDCEFAFTMRRGGGGGYIPAV